MDLSEVCRYIIDNINEDLSPESLSMIFHYNKSYLMRKFKEFTGFTISEFINECRVYNSTDPLIYTDDSILKIALTNGFNSLEYYSERFKSIIGSSPLKFRQVYSALLDLVKKSNDPEELKFIKGVLSELQEYKLYLQNIGDIVYSKEKVGSKHKVKILNNYPRNI